MNRSVVMVAILDEFFPVAADLRKYMLQSKNGRIKTHIGALVDTSSQMNEIAY